MKHVFLRDDDVFQTDKTFCKVLRFCLKEKIPVIYAVIPFRLTPPAALLLKQTKKSHPELLDIVQHGWSHANYSLRPEDKYEFGPRRTQAQQQKDMRLGQAVMERVFKTWFTPAFVPPYHGYDAHTICAVRERGYRIFSAGLPFKQKHSFLNLPAVISLNRYSKTGEPIACSCKNMILRSRGLLWGDSGSTGLVFHHRTCRTEHSWKQFKQFLLYLKKLESNGKIKLFLFSQLIKVHSKSGGRSLRRR